MINCAGIIVFHQNNTVIVSTARGNHGFPKGKRHSSETLLETAWRELQEETGLSQRDVTLIPDVFVDEQKPDKKNVSVRYFVGILKEDETPVLTHDPTELASVQWVDVEKAGQILTGVRKQILEHAFYLSNSSSDITM
jgi:8-oxo-dGTP pyrophosphatase MutT (NUDIX family)